MVNEFEVELKCKVREKNKVCKGVVVARTVAKEKVKQIYKLR